MMVGKIKTTRSFNKIYLIRIASPLVINSGGHVRHFTPPFTLKYIESLLFKAKYHTILFDCSTVSMRWEKILIDMIKWKPDVVVMFSSIHGKTMVLELSSFLKKKSDVFTVAIGEGPTHNPNAYFFIKFSSRCQGELYSREGYS